MQIAVTSEYLAALQARLRQIDEAHRGLEVERESIKRLLKLHGMSVNGGVPMAHRPAKRVGGVAVSVSQQLLNYVRDHDGCQTLDVVNAFADNVTTTSKDPRRYVRSVVDTHIKRGKISRDDDGGLHLL